MFIRSKDVTVYRKTREAEKASQNMIKRHTPPIGYTLLKRRHFYAVWLLGSMQKKSFIRIVVTSIAKKTDDEMVLYRSPNT